MTKSIFDPLRRLVRGNTHDLVPTTTGRQLKIPQEGFRYLPPVFMKRGKWVVVKGEIGIVADLSNANNAIVHLVDDQGLTVKAIQCGVNELKIAKLKDIPLPRRPTTAVGLELGYY